jgi:hypothetical protein
VHVTVPGKKYPLLTAVPPTAMIVPPVSAAGALDAID